MSHSAINKVCAVIRESNPKTVEESIQKSQSKAGYLELRLDYLPVSELTAFNLVKWVRQAGCPVIITLRRKPNGGEFIGSESEQIRILDSLMPAGMAFIDLEIETIESYLGGSLPAPQKGSPGWMASYHNFEKTPSDLDIIYRRLLAAGPQVVKVASHANHFADNFRLLALLDKAQQDGISMITVAMGELGEYSRIMAPGRGSMLTYASFEKGHETAPGQLPIDDLLEVYAVNQINQKTRIYGIVGYPLGHSLSPHIHNFAFRHVGLNARFVPFAVQELGDFAPYLRQFDGFSVTIPHKVKILEFVDEVDETVRTTGAANTLVCHGNKVRAANTDVTGIGSALQQAFTQGARQVVLLGAGGAARAAAMVLRNEKCQVTVLARDVQRAQAFAEEFGFHHDSLDQARKYSGDLLINATSVGMAPRIDQTPLPQDAIHYRFVFDMVYNPLETRLIRESQGKAIVISGLEMFIAQAALQFELWTGQPAPVELMREVAFRKLAKHGMR